MITLQQWKMQQARIRMFPLQLRLLKPPKASQMVSMQEVLREEIGTKIRTARRSAADLGLGSAARSTGKPLIQDHVQEKKIPTERSLSGHPDPLLPEIRSSEIRTGTVIIHHLFVMLWIEMIKAEGEALVAEAVKSIDVVLPLKTGAGTAGEAAVTLRADPDHAPDQEIGMAGEVDIAASAREVTFLVHLITH